MSEQRHATALPPCVHAAELRTIKDRRAAAGLVADTVDRPLDEDPTGSAPEGEAEAGEPPCGEDGHPRSPSTRRGLIGLAISGGGIRSATFSLGVIQALVEKGLFKSFDYMSTVSGGGYTGSMLSSLLKGKPEPNEEFPLDKPMGKDEPPALQHLRNGSNYLNPGGVLNTLRLPAVVARGLILNALLVLPFLMFLVVATEWLHETQAASRALTWMREGTRVVPFVGALLLVAFYVRLRGADRGDLKRRNRHELAFALLLGITGVVLLFIPFLELVDLAMATPFTVLEQYVSEHLRGQVLILAAGVVLGAYTLVKATETLDATKKLYAMMSKALLYAVAIAGPGLLVGFYLLLLVAQVDSPFLSGTYDELANPPAAGDYTIQLSDSLLLALDSKGIEYTRDTIRIRGRDSISAEVGARYCSGQKWQLPHPSALRPPSVADCGLTNEELERAGSLQSFRLAATPQFANYSYEVWGAQLHLGGVGSVPTLMPDGLFLALAFFILIFNTAFLNVNMSSLHRFYRDRLSEMYIFGLTSSGDTERTEPNDAQTLSGLSQSGSVAPYHIINTTLNLQGDRVESTRGRSADFFMFSKHYCGSPHTGYCRTDELEERDRGLTLGTAMAISAAAAAPNMGSVTDGSMVFIMTVLNFRLGYWLPNPHWVKQVAAGEKRAFPFWTFRPGTLRLLREALGSLTAQASMVNLSDGGHLENLATYELLRRRCRFILIIDGEEDGKLTFEGLVTLMRLAKIDLGITIKMDEGALERIHWGEKNATDAHFAMGRIEYGAGETGVLVYVKSSVTGDESPSLKRYRDDNPAFPHESTADQFFDEVQFEAYRALGYHVGHDVASPLTEDLGSFIDKTVAEYETAGSPA